MKIVSNVKNHVKTNLHVLAKIIKYYFYYAPKRFVMLKYYRLYELVAYRLLATTTVMVRQLLLRQGKNPDYVAPPLELSQEPSFEEVVGRTALRRPQVNIPYVPSWVRASFKNLSSHPIYKSRVGLNLQPNRIPVPSVSEPLQVVLAPEVVPEVAPCNQCLHPDHDGLHICEEFKPRLPEIELVVPEGSIDGGVTVDETGNVVFGFIKYGDKE